MTQGSNGTGIQCEKANYVSFSINFENQTNSNSTSDSGPVKVDQKWLLIGLGLET